MQQSRARPRHGVLKRLRGTPLGIGVYFVGRFASTLSLVVVVAAVLVVTAGPLWLDLKVPIPDIAMAVGVIVLGSAAAVHERERGPLRCHLRTAGQAPSGRGHDR